MWSVNGNLKYDSLGMEVDDSQSIPVPIFMQSVIFLKELQINDEYISQAYRCPCKYLKLVPVKN